MTNIPRDAREIYCNDKGEPIAYCPVDSLGVTDLQRAEFHRVNEMRLAQLAVRARTKHAHEKGPGFCVVCIDVDDPTWTFLVDALMPGHDWQAYRDRGETPIARGVVPVSLIVDIVTECYPAAGELHTDATNILVFAAGGIAIIADRNKP